MADVSSNSPAATVATSASTPTGKKAGAKKGTTKRPQSKPSHPRTSDMVNSAIKSLKERGGSSLQLIKKYLSGNYKIDAEKLFPFIKRYLKSTVASGALIQTKGKGASGSFKLAGEGGSAAGKQRSMEKKKRKVPSARSPSKTATKAPAKPKVAGAAKKVAKPKKVAAKKPKAKKTTAASPAAEKKATSVAVPAKPKTPSKAKKTSKVPTKKPKAPKPKKAKTAGKMIKKATLKKK